MEKTCTLAQLQERSVSKKVDFFGLTQNSTQNNFSKQYYCLQNLFVSYYYLEPYIEKIFSNNRKLTNISLSLKVQKVQKVVKVLILMLHSFNSELT